ncbi:ABC transporter substrate-binding protein [Corynebacterium sp. NPDC060344]|uniref:ABC transporter substrate-binding protein n=1 Tax=Corynebacterium sp. NPDC060344 TaxID=3347101 RepID=UPI0036462956
MFSRSRSRNLIAGLAGVMVSALALGACAGDGATDGAGDAAGAGAGAGGERPERIVSLSPTATESLFAIGAGDQVVAVDKFSYYPAEAPVVDGLDGHRPNVESILSHDPDLVVVSTEDDSLMQGMEAADVPVLVLPAATDLDGAYSQIETLGAETGHVGDAAEVVKDMSADIRAAVDSIPAELRDAGLTYYHEVSSDHYSVTDATFLGAVYSEFGLSSIATGDSDYPQLSAEAIVEADPDLIFLANATSESMTADDVAARPGWDQITAVRDGNITALDEDLASRWGPRLPKFFESIAEALRGAQIPAAAGA